MTFYLTLPDLLVKKINIYIKYVQFIIIVWIYIFAVERKKISLMLSRVVMYGMMPYMVW